MASSSFAVLMTKAAREDVMCRRCTSTELDKGRLSASEMRREIDKVYRGWRCGCRKFPESRVEVHVQGPKLEYLVVCVGCASELTGVPRQELLPAEFCVSVSA